MGLLGGNMMTWAQMKQEFKKNYMDYCRSKETKEEIFRMTLKLDESLEEYEDTFQLNYRRANCTLDLESLKLVLLWGIKEDVMETLNMLSRGDIYQLSYDDIKNVFKNHFRVVRKRAGLAKSW